MKKRLLTIMLAVVAVILPTNGWAQGTTTGDESAEAYVVLSDNNTVLTFYYDDQKRARVGMDINTRSWDIENGEKSPYGDITKAVFDASFANYRPTSTAYWFQGCGNMTTVEGMENLNTSNVTNMWAMFEWCSSLESLDLSHLDTSNAVSMAYMFNGCSSLQSLDVSGFNTDNATDIGAMFRHCSKLTTVDVSRFNTSKVTSLWGIFAECFSLTSLDVSNFDTGSAGNMAYMFYNCSQLQSLDVSHFNTSNATNMYGMFGGCPGLTSLDVSGFNTARVTDMGHMFYECSSLNTIYAGDGWNTSSVTEGGDMFMGCTSLVGGQGTVFNSQHTDYTYAHIDGGTENPGYFTDKNAAPSGSAEPYAVLSDNNTVLTFYYDDQKRARGGMDVGIYTQETYTQRPWHDTAAEVTKVVIDPSFANYTDLTSTACWFLQFSKLTEIEGIENIKTENVTSFEWMFRECSSLTTLDLSTFNPAHLKTIEAMFYGCSGLTTIDINHFNTSEVTHWWGLFSGCSGLTSLDVSHLDTSSAEHFNSVFEGCSNLTSLDVSHFNTSNVVWMNSLFAGCNKLKELDLRNFNTENVEYIYSMFRSCYVLTTLDLSSFNTAKVTDFDNMFSACYDLQNIFVSDLWQTTSATRGYDMFQSCNSLVGGAGTKFDANHTDYTYAHIDGGTENPGYFTRSGEAPWVEPTEKVATPTFSWNDDNLTITTTTEGATIFYSTRAIGDDGKFEEPFEPQTLYQGPVAIREDCTLAAVATAEGMANSETITLYYPYSSWMWLIETCYMGRQIIQQASGNSNVPQDMLLNVESRIYMGLDMFDERTAEQQEIEEYAESLRYMLLEIEQLMNEQTSTFDGRVLTVRGSGSIDQAVAQVGGYDYVNSTITAIVWEADVPYYGETAFTNPNLLFYANEATKDQTIRNLIYNGVAESITLTDQGEGNIDFYCPQPFTARYITYQRNFSQQTEIGVSRGWETIALPFTVQKITHERAIETGELGNITPFGTNDDNKHFWLRRMTSNGFQSVQTLEANVPYIISMPNSEAYPAEYNLAGNIYFTAENAEVPATTLVTDEWGEYTMTSTFQRLEAQESVYVLNVGEVRNGYPEGSIFERNYRATRPFEAYTTHRGSSPAPKFFMIGMPGDDGTTGIVTVGIGSPNTDSWYDLQGRKLQGRPTQKGVYIQNGKKITIK